MLEFLIYYYDWPDDDEIEHGVPVMENGKCVEAAVWLVRAYSKDEAIEAFEHGKEDGELLDYTLDKPSPNAIVIPFRPLAQRATESMEK